MSAHVTAVQRQCDWCGTLSALRPLAESGIIVETPRPDGWTSVGYGSVGLDPARAVRLMDPFGNTISDLCPACSARPVSELLEHLGGLGKMVTT